jgi:hypothetical protein
MPKRMVVERYACGGKHRLYLSASSHCNTTIPLRASQAELTY